MKIKGKERILKSNFDRNEHFGANNIPKHFDSVTDEAISELQRSAMKKVAETTRFEPGALADALDSIDGCFEGLYSTLEGDYSTRFINLGEAYASCLSDVRSAFLQYELQVAAHNIAYKNYSDANIVINGTELPSNLAISNEDLNRLRELVEKLDRSKNE